MQGKYFEMGKMLFAHQDDLEWSDIYRYANAIGLDIERFDDDVRVHPTKVLHRVQDDAQDAELMRDHRGRGGEKSRQIGHAQLLDREREHDLGARGIAERAEGARHARESAVAGQRPPGAARAIAVDEASGRGSAARKRSFVGRAHEGLQPERRFAIV